MFRKIAALMLLLGFASASFLSPVVAQKDDKPAAKKDDAIPGPKKPHRKGHIPLTPEKKAALLARGIGRHGLITKAIPKVTAATWDCRTLGLVTPVKDQGQCGSCWDFSGTEVCESAFIKAGYGKADNFILSTQYVLDCGQNGGCNGDDNTSVTTMCRTVGMPSEADYGPYQARAQRCKSTASMKMYKLADWGFCTQQGDGVAATQDIKNAMAQWGPIGCAIAADDAFSNVQAGQVFDRTTSQGIDHDIVLVGWDDSKGKNGAWLLRNSWGTSWCDGGYCWIGYGVNLVGTEAIWASATPIIPPTPPTPVPPTPVPPVPGAAPAITSALAATAHVGTAFSFQITATNSPILLSAFGLPDGLSCSTAGLITGTPTAVVTSNVTIVAANGAGATTAILVLTVAPAGGGPVSITLTVEQIKAVLEQSGSVTVTPEMTVGELMKVLSEKKSGGCCGNSVKPEPVANTKTVTVDAEKFNQLIAEINRLKAEKAAGKKKAAAK